MMERNDKFFLLGLVSLAVSLFLFPLAIYILPQAYFGWTYHIPDFISNFNEYLQDAFGMTRRSASWTVFYSIFLMAIVFANIAYFAAMRTRHDIKKSIPHENVDEAVVRLRQANQNRRETIFLVVKLVLIMVLVFSIAEIVQWVVAMSPS
jgi:hypothetical protein